MPKSKLRESRRAGKDAFFELIEYRLRRSLAGVKWDDTLHTLATLHNQAVARNDLVSSEYDIGTYDEVVSFLFREDEDPPWEAMKKAFRAVPGYSGIVLNPNTKYGAIAILGKAGCFYATLLLTKKRPTIRNDALVLEQQGGSAPHNIRENEEHVISQRIPTTPSSSASSSSSKQAGSSSGASSSKKK